MEPEGSSPHSQARANCLYPGPAKSSSYLCVYLLAYYMERSPSWEANWFAASQEIPRILWNPKVPRHTHKRPPPVPILGQPNPVLICVFTYLLTPWSRVLLEKLVKKFLAFYGTRRFLTALTSARRVSSSSCDYNIYFKWCWNVSGVCMNVCMYVGMCVCVRIYIVCKL
jgi:hypothetical protein